VTSVWRKKPSDFCDFWWMKSWGNSTAELKIVNLPTSHAHCGRTTLKSAKKSFFNNVIHMFFRMFRLLLNKMDYNVTMQLSGRSEITSYILSFRSDVPLREHNYGVCYATVRSPYPWCSAGIQSMSQPAAAATRPQSTYSGVHAKASCSRCDNP